MRRPASSADAGPCLFVVARGNQPRSEPLRLSMRNRGRVEIRRGDSLDVTARRGEPAVELAIPDTKISARHARFEWTLDRWVVKDEDSKNGTFVNGERITRAALSDGDLIDFGDTILRFREAIAHHGELVHRPRAQLRGLSSLLPSLQAELDELARMASTPITILIEGETGTGKEVVARAVHKLSGRPGRLVPVNSGSLPGERVEAELFGWRRGAFSGATADHEGLVRAADGGTLFLDEIGDLPLADQASLLRVLQEREVLPIGDTQPIAVDLRVVAATHQALDAMIGRGEFREDLLARLSGYRLRLLPLRDRREDLGLILADVLGSHDDGYRVTIGALRAMLRHDWRMNIRELEQTVTRALARCTGGVVDLVDVLPSLGRGSEPAIPVPVPPRPAPADDPLYDRLVVLLREHKGNIAAVARAMGKARMQVQRWIRRYGLVPDEFRG